MNPLVHAPQSPSAPCGNSGGWKVLDLFSGIGAYSLGLQRTGGFEAVAFCEINAFCRRILRKHWPDVPIYEDVTALTGDRLRADGIVPDWIVAGWPCQDISSAGTGHGLDGARSGLWSEVRRLAGEIRPRGLLLENSSNLLNINGGADFGRVLGGLASLGYDAEWHCLPAAAFDAPHIRDRLWIVATLANAAVWRCQGRSGGNSEPGHAYAPSSDVANIDEGQCGNARQALRAGRNAPHPCGADVPHVEGVRRQPRRPEPEGQQGGSVANGDGSSPYADSYAPIGTAISRQERHAWEPEPDVGRVVHGAPDRVERIHALGNLNPPIIPETIGRAILAAARAA